MFRPASASSHTERSERDRQIPRMRFGVDFLDDATRGIFPDDLILLGAPSGAGKTQLCCNIAQANLEDGKTVHYIALEASEYEIERRLKYPFVAERYFADTGRPQLSKKLNYPDWLLGEFSKELKVYEDDVAKFFETAFNRLHLYYKQDRFGLGDLIESVHYCSQETDLIIVDHVHYFDFDDDNENRAMREIAKTVRKLAIDEKKPIVLVAHLRKRDRQNDELVAGMEEFHGSSDLFKIATKVVTVAPGRMTATGDFETFFRIPKNRLDGGATRFLGRELYSPRKGGYEKNCYSLGWANQLRSKGFEGLIGDLYPAWAARVRPSQNGQGGDSNNHVKNHAPPPRHQGWKDD